MTWLQDANYAVTSGYAIANAGNHGTGARDNIYPDGRMGWDAAVAWVDQLIFRGYADWRLPTVAPIDGIAFQYVFSNNATTDTGYAETTTNGTDGSWRNGAGDSVSYLGHMYYVNLSNLGFCKPEDADPTDCDPQSDNTDTSFVDAITGKTVDFLNVQRGNFWFGTEFSSGDAWRLGFGVGDQYPGTKTYEFFAWPVRVGDVAAAPLPSTAVLMALGMLGLGAFRVFWRTT